jgi:SAM-dependent methyltransferase
VRLPRPASAALRRVLGPKFVKHYVRPRRIGRAASAYDAKRFFESWHRASGGTLADADTIAPGRSALASRYHYNAVENAIIEYLASHPGRPIRSVLDIGSGAGHWIGFYRDVVGAETVVGVEISNGAVAELERAFGGEVEVVQADVASPAFSLGREFDLVSAIGVMFHIVEDEAWEQALANLARHLAPDGALVVSGQFGFVTENVQFHRTDTFATWEEFRTAAAGASLVNKRIRSLRRWRRAARRAGLRVEWLKRTAKSVSLELPENNVLVLRRAGRPA